MEKQELYNTRMLAKSESQPESVGVKTDIGAVADTVTELFKLLRENINLTAKNYYQRLLGANSSYKNILGQYKDTESVFPIVVIGVGVLGIVTLVAIKMLKNENQ